VLIGGRADERQALIRTRARAQAGIVMLATAMITVLIVITRGSTVTWGATGRACCSSFPAPSAISPGCADTVPAMSMRTIPARLATPTSGHRRRSRPGLAGWQPTADQLNHNHGSSQIASFPDLPVGPLFNPGDEV
jgi:hypothetical protein